MILRWIKVSHYLQVLTKVLYNLFFLRESRKYFRIVQCPLILERTISISYNVLSCIIYSI